MLPNIFCRKLDLTFLMNRMFKGIHKKQKSFITLYTFYRHCWSIQYDTSLLNTFFFFLNNTYWPQTFEKKLLLQIDTSAIIFFFFKYTKGHFLTRDLFASGKNWPNSASRSSWPLKRLATLEKTSSSVIPPVLRPLLSFTSSCSFCRWTQDAQINEHQ